MSVLQSGALLWWDSRGHVPVTKGTMLGMEGPQGKDAGREGHFYCYCVYCAKHVHPQRYNRESPLSFCGETELREGTSAPARLGSTLRPTGFLGHFLPA